MNQPDLYILTREDGRKVYHLGSLGLPFDMVPANQHNLPPYIDGSLNFTMGQYCQTTATDRINCPVVLRRSPAQIVAANRMFAYGDTGCTVPPPPEYADFSGPMDIAWLTAYMPTTGERPDIGLITDASAYYMLGATPTGMIAAAHAAGSCPVHFRDESAGRPVDLFKYPQANSYMDGGQGGPHLLFGPPDPDPGGYCLPKPMTPQMAHYPEMSYLAYCATLDAGFLEDLQYSTNFTTGISDAGRSTPTLTVTWGELRGIAWAFRNLFMCHTATLDAEAAGTLPAVCHPSSYWKKLLDNQLVYYTTNFMNDPTNQVFRLVSGGPRFAPWQVDYMLSALAFGVLTGHSDWIPLYLWAFKNVVDRTSGKSGYPVGWGGAYYLNVYPWLKNDDGSWNQGAYDTTKPFDWYNSFLFLQNDDSSIPPTADQIATLKDDPFNGGVAITGHEYLMTTCAVLVMAQYLELKGLVNVRAVYPDLDLCFTNVDRMVRAGGYINSRQSIVLDASQAPDTIPPLPPIIPQPPTEIHMSDTKLAIGETKHITIAITPPDADQTGLAYTATPDGLGTLTPDATGVAITRVAKGTITIEADLNGLKATAEALDAVPLADAIALSWDS